MLNQKTDINIGRLACWIVCLGFSKALFLPWIPSRTDSGIPKLVDGVEVEKGHFKEGFQPSREGKHMLTPTW